MNIQQYYRHKANVSLNGSLAAFVPVLIIIIGSFYFSAKLPLLLLVLPFCLYSFICYQSYLVDRQRSLESELTNSSKPISLIDNSNLLITFMPAPSLRMQLFDPNGNLVGEVKDSRFWWWRWFLPYFIDCFFPSVYALYDHNQEALAFYKISKNKGIEIFNPDRKKMGIYLYQSEAPLSLKRKGSIHSLTTNQSIFVEGSSIYPDIKLRNEQGFIIGKLIKGWMPKEWGKHFRDVNTPFISIDQSVDETERILIIGVLAEFFQYTTH